MKFQFTYDRLRFYKRSLLLGSLPYRTTKTKLMTKDKMEDDHRNRSIDDSWDTMINRIIAVIPM